MTPEQFAAIMVAFTGLIGAVTALLVAVHNLHSAVNGRLTQLLAERETAARKDGELAGRDFMRRLMSPPQSDSDTFRPPPTE
jgi:hypothetical protein